MNSEIKDNNIKSDEKTLAMFSHLSLFLGGIVLPIIFWAINKDKSKFVTFHALQAVWFHVAYIFGIVFVAMFAAIGGYIIVSLFWEMSAKFNSGPPAFNIVLIFVYGIIILIVFAGIGYAIYMGIEAHKGELKKYPVIGNIIYKKVYGSN